MRRIGQGTVSGGDRRRRRIRHDVEACPRFESSPSHCEQRGAVIIVIGVDPSLTATGIAVLDTTEWATERSCWEVTTIPGGAVPETDYGMLRRMHSIASSVYEFVTVQSRPQSAGVVVVEGPAFSQNNGKSHERAGLWWMMYGRLAELHAGIVVVKPNVRAKYATGNGKANKDSVMLAASRRYTDAAISNNNESDAVVLAAMGARLLGEPVEASLPLSHLAAMKTLTS